MANGSNRFVVVFTILGLLLSLGCTRRNGFTGTWVKKTGDYSPIGDVVAIRHAANQFRLRYPVQGGVETVTLQLDGNEHVWQKGFGVVETYRATLQGEDLLLATAFSGQYVGGGKLPLGLSVAEQWSVQDGGHRLVISSFGKQTAVYERAPFTRSLFTGLP